MSSAAHPDDPTIKFTRADTGESEEMEYEWPSVDADSEARTKKHQVINAETVVQHMGTKAKEYEIRCHCYYDEGQFLEDLTSAPRVRVRSHRLMGYVVVDHVSTMQSGTGGGKRPGIENRLLDYRVRVTKTTPPPPEES